MASVITVRDSEERAFVIGALMQHGRRRAKAAVKAFTKGAEGDADLAKRIRMATTAIRLMDLKKSDESSAPSETVSYIENLVRRFARVKGLKL